MKGWTTEEKNERKTQWDSSLSKDIKKKEVK